MVMVPLKVWLKGNSARTYMNDIFQNRKPWNMRKFEEAEYDCHNDNNVFQLDINMTVNYDRDRTDLVTIIENSSVIPRVHEPQYRKNTHKFAPIEYEDDEETIFTPKYKKAIVVQETFEEKKIVIVTPEEERELRARREFEDRLQFEYRRFSKHKKVEEKHATLNRLVSMEMSNGKKYVDISNETWWRKARIVIGKDELMQEVKDLYYDIVFR